MCEPLVQEHTDRKVRCFLGLLIRTADDPPPLLSKGKGVVCVLPYLLGVPVGFPVYFNDYFVV